MAGSRHLEVVALLGRPIEQRALFIAGDDLTDSDHTGLREALARLEQVDVWALAASRSLRDLAAGPLGELISTAFRVVPRQPRSMETVERLLAAGEAIIKRKRRLDRLTMETVSDEAGITPQAAYRYFGDVHALILLGMRRVQAFEHERLLAFMTAHAFETEADLANAAVAFVIQAYQGMARIPATMRHRIARDYFDICYDVLWKISEAIHAEMVRRGGPCAGIDAMQLAAGLTAVAAVAKSLLLSDIALLRQPGAQLMLVDIFLGALRRRLDHRGHSPEDGRQGPAPNDSITSRNQRSSRHTGKLSFSTFLQWNTANNSGNIP